MSHSSIQNSEALLNEQILTLSPLQPEYPSKLLELAEPPSQVSLLGHLGALSRPCLAIVGARHSSLLAESWMRQNLREISKLCTIVSGGARGIDETAHAIAIEEGQPTVVVLPSGLGCPYPKEWRERYEKVLNSGGAIVTEYPFQKEIRSWHFEKRNRIIAALADIVLVVEARKRSGTQITVRHALDLGRTIAAIPWFPGDSRGEFCNEILMNGGMMVRNSSDLAVMLLAETQKCHFYGVSHSKPV